MNADNSPSSDPRASAPSVGKFKRYDMKKLLGDPELRRKLIVQGTIATQAREGIDVSEAQAEDSYYVVTQAERAAFLGLVPFRSEAGENDGRHVEFVKSLYSYAATARTDVTLRDFESIDSAPLAYDKLSLIGSIFRENPKLDPTYATAAVGLQTSDDARFVRCHWEVLHDSHYWVPFSKGGAFCRFYSDTYLRVNWRDDGAEMKAWAGSLYNNSHWTRIIKNTELYFLPGLTWPRRTARGLSVRVMPKGGIFADKGPALFPKNDRAGSYLLGVVNTRLFEHLFTARTSFSWETGLMRSSPVPVVNADQMEKVGEFAQSLFTAKETWDTGNEICTRFSRPWVLQSECADGAKTLSAALDQVLRHEVFLDAQLTETYARLNDEVYRLYGVNAELRAKIEAAIGERPPELVWPQMEGKDRDQKRREHVDRLLTYLVKQILEADEDHLVCLQRVAHEPPLIERLREKLSACFPEQDPSALETEVVNELKKKTKGYHRAESLAEWLHDVFFETHNALYQQRPIIWHLASSQTRTEPGFACLVHAHHFDADALAKLRSVYVKDRITVLRREAAQAGQDGKADLRLDLLALAEEVEAYDAKLAHLQEGAHTGPEGGERDYRILTPWKSAAERPKGWKPDIDDGIKVNLAPLARTNLLRRRLKLGEVKDED